MGCFADSSGGDRASRRLGSGGQLPPLPLASGPGLGFDGLLVHWPIANGLDALTMDFDQSGAAVRHQLALRDHPVEPRILGMECLVVFIAPAIACGPRWVSTTQFTGQLFGHINHFRPLAATAP